MLAIATTGSSFGTPGSTQVTDANGAGISGTFTTGSRRFPSGNGLAGSTFDFFFNVLPGDGNRRAWSTRPTRLDAKALLNDHETGAGYSPFYDYYGAGVDQFRRRGDSRRGLEHSSVGHYRADCACGSQGVGTTVSAPWHSACKRRAVRRPAVHSRAASTAPARPVTFRWARCRPPQRRPAPRTPGTGSGSIGSSPMIGSTIGSAVKSRAWWPPLRGDGRGGVGLRFGRFAALRACRDTGAVSSLAALFACRRARAAGRAGLAMGGRPHSCARAIIALRARP